MVKKFFRKRVQRARLSEDLGNVDPIVNCNQMWGSLKEDFVIFLVMD